jgi:hypothetical protein
MCSTRYSYQISIILKFPGRIFEKSSNTKFRENPSSESRAFPCGETDRQNMTKLAVACRSSAQAPKRSIKESVDDEEKINVLFNDTVT